VEFGNLEDIQSFVSFFFLHFYISAFLSRKIILKWILGNRFGMCGLDSSGSGWLVGSCEHGNEFSGSIKRREFPD
jgi:hypothetical protein